jgi:hypothetical protein
MSSEDHYDEDAMMAEALALSSGAAPSAPAAAGTTGSASTAEQDAADYAAAEKALADADDAAPQIHMHNVGESADWEEEMVPVPVNNEFLEQLIEMGVTDVRGRKALVHGGSVEGALTWLSEHQDDADIDQPYMVRKKDTLPKPVLTEEEKLARVEAMKDKIKQRREERAKQERAEEIRREKDRRERGQRMDETLEERQRQQRKRDLDKAKREKEEEAKERARLRAEIARDKEMRRKNNGVLPSVLGVEGYNPPIIQYNQPGGDAPAAGAPAPSSSTATPKPAVAAAPAAPASAAAAVSPEAKIEQAIGMISRYRTAGDGGQALKLLLTFVKNIVEHPDDPKYRSINPESAAFKSKLASLVGPPQFFKYAGFERDNFDGKLKYAGAADHPVLLFAHRKLVEADALYQQQNPV